MMDIKEIKGKDEDRCVFKVKKDAANTSFYKLYFSIINKKTKDVIADKYADFQREAFITSLLQQEGMGNIVKMDEASLKMSDKMYKEFEAKATDCGDKMREAKGNIPYFATRALDDKTISLSDWLARQPEEVKPEIIRTFAIQLIYLVGKIQAKFGVQHNDLYEENIMVRPVDTTKTLTLTIGSDLFQVELLKGHVEVFLFDFGASTLKKSPTYPAQGNAWEIVTPVALQHNNPPEKLFTADDTQKHAESDAFMIGHVLLTLAAHNYKLDEFSAPKFTYRPYMGLHVYDLSPQQAKDVGLTGSIITDAGLDQSGDGSIVYQKLNMTLKAYGTTKEAELPEDRSKTNELFFVNLIALNVILNGYDKGTQVPEYIAKTNSKVTKQISALFEHVRKEKINIVYEVGKWKNTYKDVFPQKYVKTHFEWLKTCLEKQGRNYFSLMRKLMNFDPVERRAFALPGTSYCLLAALFHPYFSEFYKGKDTTLSVSVATPFVPPLEYATDVGKKERLKEVETKEEAFYVDRFLDYIEAYPNDDVSIAYKKDIAVSSVTFENLTKLAQNRFENVIMILQPNSNLSKADAKNRFIELSKLAMAKKPASQAEIDRLREEERIAKEAADKAAKDAQAKADADAKAKADAEKAAQDAAQKKAEAEAAEKRKQEEEARVVQLAKEKKDAEDAAKQAADEAARKAAEQEAADTAKKLADEAERLRLATEEEERKKQEAAQAKADADRAALEADKAKREAEEAERAKEVAKAKATEEASKLAEASGPFTSDERKVMWLMRQLAKDINFTILSEFETKHGNLEQVFVNAYDIVTNYIPKDKSDILLPLYTTLKRTALILRVNMFAKKAYKTNDIAGWAAEILSLFYLTFTITETKDLASAQKNFFSDFPTTNDTLEAWINTKMGAFLDQYMQESTAKETKGTENKELSTTETNVLGDANEALGNMKTSTLALIGLIEELIDTSKEPKPGKSTPTTPMTDHQIGIAAALYNMALSFNTLYKEGKLSAFKIFPDTNFVLSTTNEPVPKQIIGKQRTENRKIVYDIISQNVTNNELKDKLVENKYVFTATKNNYSDPWTKPHDFLRRLIQHIVIVGLRSILITQNPDKTTWEKFQLDQKAFEQMWKNASPDEKDRILPKMIYEFLQFVKKTISSK